MLGIGELPESLQDAARIAHDEMPHPRATVWWTPAETAPGRPTLPQALVLGSHDDVGAEVMRVQAALLRGERASDSDLLPDVDPAPWRGVGPYGQGGKGMTGGVPYGRPLAERAPDRDGLELDQLPVRVGPFFPAFPPGLVLELKLQGDVVQAATVGENAFAIGEPQAVSPTGAPDPFVRALSEPVPIAELELARARHHLVWLGDALRVHGLGALGRRAWRLANGIARARASEEVRTLRRVLEATRSLAWATVGVGVTDPPMLAEVPPGPVARAAGMAADARAEDPAYVGLGFQPVVQREGDTRARWRQRLEEALQALELAARAGGRASTPRSRVESPRGTLTPDAAPSAQLLTLIPPLITGAEWGDAVTSIVSLDLDLEEAARRPSPTA
jgi:hypothetical protein